MIRSLPAKTNEIYLTFDDGPDPGSSAAVLDVLKAKNAPSTFFLIAEKARREKDLLKRLRDEGHAIGNHSLDHDYGRYFQGPRGLTEWVESSEAVFGEIGAGELVGFRPPAGICTPPLVRVLKRRNEPLILWNHRFYDAVFTWTRERAFKAFKTLKAGDIVLLHDRQPPEKTAAFCSVLGEWIDEAKRRGFRPAALNRNECLKGKV